MRRRATHTSDPLHEPRCLFPCNTLMHVSLQMRLGLFSYFILGAAFLAPWNAYLTAIDYFTAVYVRVCVPLL